MAGVAGAAVFSGLGSDACAFSLEVAGRLQAAALLRSVTALRNFTEAISRLSMSSVVLV
jgi:hypothetical protein